MQIQNRWTGNLPFPLIQRKPGFSSHARNRSPSRNQAQVSTFFLSRASYSWSCQVRPATCESLPLGELNKLLSIEQIVINLKKNAI
jgi:hypothetical protein